RPVLYIIETIGDEMKVQKKISFAKVAGENIDIEEVTIAGEVIYAISGDGRLFEINDWKGSPQFRELKTGLSKSNNTEGLCFDPETKKLLIACKDDSGLEDEKKSTKVIYSYNPETEKTEGPFLKIEQDDLESFSGEKIKLNPSSIAVHPITKEIYVLSSKGSKCLVVLSREGAVRSVNFINDDLMHQPEGICFSDKGDMYLSSEGKKGNPGKLFLYSIKQ